VTLMDDEGKPLKKKGLVLALKVCWNNGGILMRIVTVMKTHTMISDCDEDPYDDDRYEGQDILLTRFKIYAIILRYQSLRS
ncbi:hypothetical protein Tco_0279912, partial [Tanacetum coccineum]